MNKHSTNMISVRAIEDVISIQKIIQDIPNLKGVELDKKKSEERVVYSVLKHKIYSTDKTNNSLDYLIKKCDVENSFKYKDKNCKRLEMTEWEGDCALPKYDMVALENFGILEEACSEPDAKYWSSDSDVTVLRVKKEFRNELSSKTEWEEQRNLADDISLSSTNLDWESHSLINLAEILSKDKDVKKGLTPFTIWSRAKERRNSSMILMEEMKSFAAFEPCTGEFGVEVENENAHFDRSTEKFRLAKRKVFKNFFRPIFSCFTKKNSF